MGFGRKGSFENRPKKLLNINLQARYNEKAFKQFMWGNSTSNEDEEDKEASEMPQLFIARTQTTPVDISKQGRFLFTSAELESAILGLHQQRKQELQNGKSGGGTADFLDNELLDTGASNTIAEEPPKDIQLKLKNKRRRLQRKLRKLNVIDSLSDTNA